MVDDPAAWPEVQRKISTGRVRSKSTGVCGTVVKVLNVGARRVHRDGDGFVGGVVDLRVSVRPDGADRHELYALDDLEPA